MAINEVTGDSAKSGSTNIGKSGTADTGRNPVKVGGVYNSTKPVLTDGQRGDVQVGTRGSLIVQLAGADGASTVTAGTPADATAGQSGAFTDSFGMLFNGTTWDRARAASATDLALQSGLGVALTALPGQWSVVHAPAANTQATISKAAGAAGVRHVCTGISATFVAGATAPVAVQVTVNVRDGATGAGTIIWTGVLSLPATAGSSAFPIHLSGLNLVGTAATAMTIEFSAAGGANTVEAVALQGYSAA